MDVNDPRDQATREVSEAVEGSEEATGAVGLVVGMLTGGFAVATAAGLLVDLAVGFSSGGGRLHRLHAGARRARQLSSAA